MVANGFEGDYELSLGSITGVRAFKTDWLGRLTGISQTDSVFTPEVNKAQCYLCSTKDMASCVCGFYAYFRDQDNSFMGGENIGGVIEGTGRTVLGPKGFRTENAKLVALFPLGNDDTTKPPSWLLRKTRWLYPTSKALDSFDDMYAAPLAYVLTIVLSVFLAVMGIISLFTSDWLLGTWMLPLALWGAGWVRRFASLSAYGYRPKFHRLNRPEKSREPKEASPFDRLKELYPDVPVYDSMRAALKKHPVDKVDAHIPELPSPATEDNFWQLPVNPQRDLDYF